MKNGKVKKNPARYIPFVITKKFSHERFFIKKDKLQRTLKDDEQ